MDNADSNLYRRMHTLIVCRLIVLNPVKYTQNLVEVKPMDIIKVFGSNVRKYRTEKGVSQEKFAELCGLHRTYISDIECFRRSISLDNIQKIAYALEIETFKLFIEGSK